MVSRSASQFNFAEGDDVLASDGDKVGNIVAVQPNYIVVEKGFFFPTDYYIPTSAVASYDEGRVYLNVTKDAALNQGWDQQPTTDADYATTGTTVAGRDAGTYDAATTGAAYDTTRVTDDDTLRVQVHEEELTATTRQREIGEVQITKDVVAEERVLEVPVTEERVRVERRVVDRPGVADDTAFEEGTIAVPVRGEDVEVQKQVRVAEEIEIAKEAVQRTEQAGGTVRREEVRIDENVDVDTTTGTTGTTGSTGTTLP